MEEQSVKPQTVGQNWEEEQLKDISKKFDEIYMAFRMALYRRIFAIMGKRDGSLTATDYFSVETIYLMGEPTISEFAEMLSISAPNATYRVKTLIEKGYVVKEETERKNTFRLRVTEKFMRFYHEEIDYGTFMLHRFSSSMKKGELAVVDDVLDKIIKEIKKEDE